MDRGHDVPGQRRFDQLATVLRHLEVISNQRLCCGRAATHHDFWFQQAEFGIQPWPTRGDFARVGLFVNAPLAFRFPFEVLHRIGDVNLVAIDAGFDKRFVEQLARRADKWFAREVFVVTRLFPYKNNFCVPRPFAKNRLRSGLPQGTSLAAARGCQACPLWKTGTQTVFGEGSRHAKVVFVGEQPGNDEDLAGKPFVGPAGKLLDKALVEAGINRDEVYVTNAVKHFKWEPKGKRRIHKKPNAREIAACRPWLDAELEVLKPQVVVCLGATAAQGLLGKDFSSEEDTS